VIFVVVSVLVLLPLALIFIYRSPSIHPVSTLMLRDLVLQRGYQRHWVDFDDISPVLVQSVLTSEDGKFCFHNGVDWGAVDVVIDEALEGERSRGASTIPMQTAKNLFLWSSRSYVRKVLEVPLALTADAAWPKRRLMEIYLNVAEWGPGIFGIEAAAQHYYGVSAGQLSRRRAAYLAVTLPNPYRRNPVKPSRGLARLASIIERRASQSGAYIKCLDE
jgi:monofunctional biosynthetic peptidoglycan transglycosylase